MKPEGTTLPEVGIPLLSLPSSPLTQRHSNTRTQRILDLLNSQAPARIATIVRQRSPHFPHDPDTVVAAACSHLNIAPTYRLLVVQTWARHTTLVFDIHHSAYDVSTAHREENLLVLNVAMDKQIHARISSDDFRDMVNAEVAMLHNVNGWEKSLPYFEDQTAAVWSYRKP